LKVISVTDSLFQFTTEVGLAVGALFQTVAGRQGVNCKENQPTSGTCTGLLRPALHWTTLGPNR